MKDHLDEYKEDCSTAQIEMIAEYPKKKYATKCYEHFQSYSVITTTTQIVAKIQ